METSEIDSDEQTQRIDGNVYVIRQGIYALDRPFTEEQRAEVGERMAEALRRKSTLEDELDEIRKSFNTDIKAADKEAMSASREWRRGTLTCDVECDVLADYTTHEIVAVEMEPPHTIVNRRSMTAEERNKPLPGLFPSPDYAVGNVSAVVDKALPGLCVDCGHIAGDNTDGELPEPCLTCSGCDNGSESNWLPKHGCTTCVHSEKNKTKWPCAGCLHNPDSTHAGVADKWAFLEITKEALQ